MSSCACVCVRVCVCECVCVVCVLDAGSYMCEVCLLVRACVCVCASACVCEMCVLNASSYMCEVCLLVRANPKTQDGSSHVCLVHAHVCVEVPRDTLRPCHCSPCCADQGACRMAAHTFVWYTLHCTGVKQGRMHDGGSHVCLAHPLLHRSQTRTHA
jgi:hypothetical protein